MSTYDPSFVKGSSATYWKAINLLEVSWRLVTGKDLGTDKLLSPSKAYLDALAKLEAGFRKIDEGDRKAVRDHLDDNLSGDPNTKNLYKDTRNLTADQRKQFVDRDIDLVPPRLIFDTLHSVALSYIHDEAQIDLPLRSYLIDVMKEIAPKMSWNTPLKVGDNRHFPRLWQWFCEYSDSTKTTEGYGIRALNTRGPVAWLPAGPGELRVRIESEHLL